MVLISELNVGDTEEIDVALVVWRSSVDLNSKNAAIKRIKRCSKIEFDTVNSPSGGFPIMIFSHGSAGVRQLEIVMRDIVKLKSENHDSIFLMVSKHLQQMAMVSENSRAFYNIYIP